MIHAIAYILFILPFTAWLRFELVVEKSLKKHWGWLLGAFLVGVTGSIASNIFLGISGNFILHASGGVASTLLYYYLIKTLSLNFNWRVNLIVLFAFVSMLGVVNEIAEYLLELVGIGVYSYDSHDTWRDFVANTTGMLLAWVFINTVFRYILSKTSVKK